MATFCECACLGLNTQRTFREKTDCKQSKEMSLLLTSNQDWISLIFSSKFVLNLLFYFASSDKMLHCQVNVTLIVVLFGFSFSASMSSVGFAWNSGKNTAQQQGDILGL